MAEPTRFENAPAYEQFMGKWSCLVGDVFLSWLAPVPGQRWLDVGCGNGVLSELIVRHAAPSEVLGIDPSEAQVDYARTRLAGGPATFRCGDATALPYEDATFDVAVMGLVLFFVPEPARAVAEMARVVRPGGVVASYAWDALGGGFPTDPVFVEMRAMGLDPPLPPSVHAAGIRASTDLWTAAGLRDVATRAITVERTFADFEDFWSTCLLAPTLGPRIKAMEPTRAATLEARVRARLAPNDARPLTCRARANAIKGTRSPKSPEAR